VVLPPFNRVNVPPRALASAIYNEKPVSLEIDGTRRAHPHLFEHLDGLGDHAERTGYFKGYMDVAFRLHQWADETARLDQLSIKNSYIRFLMGWMYDSNSPEGAVLKGWVESRFGIPPTFHRTPLDGADTPGYFRYEQDRAKGFGCTNAILHQLDLVYEFIQSELRLRLSGVDHLTLYRGVTNFEEHRILEDLGAGRHLLWLNNLNSFTREFERAWEFGDRVMEAKVPLTKIFYDGDLLNLGVLHGEEEVMVIGGQYDVKVRWY